MIHWVSRSATGNKVVHLELQGKEEEEWFLEILQEQFGEAIFSSQAGRMLLNKLEDK